MKTRRFILAAMAAVALAWAPICFSAAGDATLIFRKTFKFSSPEYVEIKVDEHGSGSYDIRQLSESPNPEPLTVSPQLAVKMFALAAQLNNFHDQHLEVRRRIANLGQKTFRYEHGAEAYETTFNYTMDANANELLEIFEGLSREHQHMEMLARTMRYDRLGVNDALMQFETDYNHKLIPEPERMLPLLDQIAGDSRFVSIARERAKSIAARIRSQH